MRRILYAAILAPALLAACGPNEPATPPLATDGGLDSGADAGDGAPPVPDAGDVKPSILDSDCDGLEDATEDANGNGVLDPGETDPFNPDTDGDGLPDGLEAGVTEAPLPESCPDFEPDLDPATTTDPTLADTDGDGVLDGAEDLDRNGRVDEGELDPNDGEDGKTLAGGVCFGAGPGPVSFSKLEAQDLQFGLPPGFSDDALREVVVGDASRGVIGYDAQSGVALLGFARDNGGGPSTLDDDELWFRTQAALDPPRARQRFTTWDGHAALKVSYVAETSVHLLAYVNTLADALLGDGAGSLTGEMDFSGPFTLQVKFVQRPDRKVVVATISTPARHLDELMPGLAQSGDGEARVCERPSSGKQAVDFLFVVDDSGSMAASQYALAQAATTFADRLERSGLDWRIGLVTTTYPTPGRANSGVFRAFTSNLAQVQAWLTQNTYCDTATQRCRTGGTDLVETSCSSNAQCWVGISGSGNERPLEAARAGLELAFDEASPEEVRIRTDALPIVVLFTDTADVSPSPPSLYEEYFREGNPTGQPITVHGILCPMGLSACGLNDDAPNERLTGVVASTGGVEGDIRGEGIKHAVEAIVDDTLAAMGHALGQAPVTASVRAGVAEVADPDGCPNARDLPRSREDGFDVDEVRGTVTFHGACRPATPETEVVVSYKAWSGGL